MSESNKPIEGCVSMMLPCKLSDAQQKALAAEMAKATVEKESHKQALKSITAQYKAKIEDCETVLRSAAQSLRTGVEFRMVDCIVKMNCPVHGSKNIIRLDTQETIIEEMTACEAEACEAEEEEEKAKAEAEAEKPDAEEGESDALAEEERK